VDPRLSAPEVQWPGPPATTVDGIPENTANEDEHDLHAWDPSPDLTTDAPEEEPAAPALAPDTLEMELERRWILNLSMHFRDRSEREKFFVTYAETPTRWRRVTISCDYRDAPPDSLEQDLKELRYQRDKCARIYESIRESLPEIQFYDTVTNLKVETRDGRLHVHVTEDVNETIPYPPISSIGHLRGARCVPEHFLHFESHLSGFVYKVRLGGKAYIKKEIPGPDTVDEFLYEINALHALSGSPNVISVEGIVVDERQEKVKGLLISYAEQGALVDILYEQRGEISFTRREVWAKQIVQGLCEIHESGYVQGDFTLSNIVVDGDDNASIIDINRRGCPVGWEPPEIAAKIESNQRISMYIGVKTDLYQLGMTLWALAMEEDEPERQPRPLLLGDVDVPDYYRRLVDICLSPTPRHRLSAKELLSFFPPDLLSRELYPVNRIRELPHSNLPPLVTKSNGDNPRFVINTCNYITSKGSFEKYAHAHSGGSPQPIFDGHDQAKRSTPTLAGSNAEARFPSGHSSTSTLNHHEPHAIAGGWDSSRPPNDLTPEVAVDNKMQNAVPSVWANTMSHSPIAHVPEQPSVLEESSNLEGREAEDALYSTSHDAPTAPAPAPVQSSIDSTSLPGPSEPVPKILAMDEQVPESGRETALTEPQTTGPSQSSSSLLLSVLPINPAFSISRPRSFPGAKDTRASSERPRSGHSRPTTFLAESLLPINPAFISRPKPFPINATRDTDSSSERPKSSHTTRISTFLTESLLPINPAFRERFSRRV
jgi:serine/threonine protein kinase